MATTGQQVFELAVVLIDEMPENGIIVESDVKSYSARTPAILSMLEMELSLREGLDAPAIITDLAAPLTVSDRTARMAMPYGLAAHLLLDENADSASYFNQKYEELRSRIPRDFIKTTDVYGADAQWP